MPSSLPTGIGFALLPAVLGGFLLYRARVGARRSRLVSDLPTSKAAGVSVGLVELSGTAESEAPLTSRIAQQACVLYRYKVLERYRREHRTAGHGRQASQVRVEEGWRSVAGAGEQPPFYLADDSGVVQVDPAGARLALSTFFSQRCRRGDSLYTQYADERAVSGSTGERLVQEEGIALHEPIYVIGRSRLREDVVAAEIARDDDAPLFEISTSGERSVRRRHRTGSWIMSLIGVALFGLAGGLVRRALIGAGVSPGAPFDTDRPYVIAGIAIAVAYVFAGWVIAVYNGLVDQRERAERAGSGIDVELQRRADLIPRLIEALGAERKYEAAVQTAVSEMRAQVGASSNAEGVEPSGVASRVNVLVEAYPELRSDAAFRNLAEELSETESRIAMARASYNDFATHYNIRLEQVPELLVAPLLGFGPMALLEAQGFERKPVEVDLKT